MKISDFMTTEVISCSADKKLKEAAQIMIEKGLSVLPVVDSENRLTGILTESDFVGKEVEVPHALASVKMLFGQTHYHGNIEEVYKKAKDQPLEKVMTKNPVTVSPEETLTGLVNLMSSRDLKRVPVVKDKKLVGIVTRKDLIKAFSMVE
ncbi:MAG: CBS domain-containing protein [Desulfobacteraceae bacterium]|nr:CBS domain-containing protein [Desulfobacteraceae bacterium]MCB9494955.1 CBS domain-containing protein [Desulfobacteraceae bacterium]